MGRGEEAGPDTRRDEARELALRGDAAFGSGRCDKAIGLWQEADARFHAPTLVLRIARCEALLGRVVAATARLSSIVAEPRGRGDPAPWFEATDAAARELPSVRARIAGLAVAIEPEDAGRDGRAELDEVALDLGGANAVDPGRHLLRVNARGARWEQTVELEEGEQRRMRFSVAQEATPVPPQTQRRVAYALFGGGVAVAAAGALAFGVPALGLSRKLEAACGPTRKECPADLAGDVAALNRDALVADLGVGVGAALAVSGVIVFLASPRPVVEPPRFRVIPLAGGAAVSGAF